MDLFERNRGDIQAAIAGGNPNERGTKTAVVAEEDRAHAPALAAAETAGKGRAQGAPFDKDDALERGLCFGFQSGKCKAVGGKCPNGFKHELAKKGRAASPPRKGVGKGDTSKVPCRFFSQGSCLWGEKCTYSHGTVPTTGASAPVVTQEAAR